MTFTKLGMNPSLRGVLPVRDDEAIYKLQDKDDFIKAGIASLKLPLGILRARNDQIEGHPLFHALPGHDTKYWTNIIQPSFFSTFPLEKVPLLWLGIIQP